MKIQFIDHEKLLELSNYIEPENSEIDAILNKALKLKGLNLKDTAKILQIKDKNNIDKLLNCANIIKEKIYGKRIVLFAPLYIANKCSNDCSYCGFRNSNKIIKRVILNQEQIYKETLALLKEGHKRVLVLCGESKESSIDYVAESIRTIYSVKTGNNYIRRINVEIAPLEINEFKILKETGIGTYTCFQETYNPETYKDYHVTGPKSNYEYRLSVMDRAIQSGINDVGIGVLFGLTDYRYEVLALIDHANHLEEKFNCGPHTVSVPRIEYAEGAPLTSSIPYPVSDDEFKKIIAVLRIALPYTGIILSTRENEKLRNELFKYGVSQISAGSRTNPGAYSKNNSTNDSGSQFSLGDHRSLEEIVSKLIDMKHIPSFCTGCYRKGRVGQDFMDLAKPGLIRQFCMPNGLFTFYEYLLDFASKETLEKGNQLIEEIINEEKNENLKKKINANLSKIKNGERDLYL